MDDMTPVNGQALTRVILAEIRENRTAIQEQSKSISALTTRISSLSCVDHGHRLRIIEHNMQSKLGTKALIVALVPAVTALIIVIANALGRPILGPGGS